MIAITFALPAESSGLIRQLGSKQVSTAGNTAIFRGQLSGRDVAIFHTGVGRTACQSNIQSALGTVRPRLLISSGFAGSLTDQLGVGDLIVAQNFSQWRFATQLTEAGSDIRGGTRFRPAILFTSNRLVESAAERQEIAAKERADAIDMETEVIATACALQHIPMISLRVISDTPASPFPVPAQVMFDITRQRTNLGSLLLHVLRHPSAIKRLIRFARQIASARSRLTSALVEVVGRLDVS